MSCRSLTKTLLKYAVTAETTIQDGKDSCTFAHLAIGVKSYRGWTIEQLRIAGPDFQHLGRNNPLPQSLAVDVKGIRTTTSLGNSHTQYIMAVSQKPMEARLSYDWDKANRQLHVHEVTLASPGLGRVNVELDADLPDLASPDHLDPRAFGIRRLHLVLDNRALVESMLIPVLVGMLPPDKDPAVEFPKFQKKIQKELDTIPAPMVDDQSKDALHRFVRDFPHPTGHFEETFEFEPPLRLEDMNVSKTDQLLHRARIRVSYSPAQ
jgi:hypothetical protein